jgi:hypothetical protein
MDPTTPFCPNLACPARGQSGRGNIGIHSRKDKRFSCHACQKTCSATPGTVFSRLRPSAETGVIVVTWRAHGGPVHAMVAALGFDARPRADGWARSGRQGQGVHASRVEPPRDLGPVQAAALRGKKPGGSGWLALALMGKTRLGLGGAVSEPRALPRSRRLSERVRRGAGPRPRWFCPAGWCTSLRALRETWRAPVRPGTGGRPRRRPWRHVLLAQVGNRDARRRGVDTERRLVDGPPARGATRRRRAHGDGVSHTASIERLNATFRERRAPLARRCRALARETLTLHEGMCLVGTVSNFCTPHASLGRAQKTTPAMAAGITDHGWTRQELLSFHVPRPRWVPPKQRGRPSRALQRLIKRWCS